MRSCITAFNSDPYLTLLFKKSFECWRDEIDELVVCFHSNNEEINQFNASVFKDFGNYRYKIVNGIGELGIALDEVYPLVQGDRLMVIDSDNFIFKKGVVSRFFDEIGHYNAIGSGGNCVNPLSLSEDIAKASSFGYVRLNTFMAFFDKLKLDKINPTFRRMFYRDGEVIEPIGYKVNLKGLPQKKMYIDTMSYLSLEFGKLGRVKLIPPREYDESYMHIGGLSSMSNRFLQDPYNLGYSVMGVARRGERFDTKFSKRKLAWHLFMFYEGTRNRPLGCFDCRYIESLLNKIKQSGFTEEDLEPELEIIRKLWK